MAFFDKDPNEEEEVTLEEIHSQMKALVGLTAKYNLTLCYIATVLTVALVIHLIVQFGS